MKKDIKLLIIIFIHLLGIITISCLALFLFKKPFIKLKGEEVVSLEVNNEYKEAGYELYFGKKNKNYYIKGINNVNNKKLGSYKVIYYFNDKNIERVVEVIDSTKPIIKLKGNEKAYVCPNSEYKEEGYEVTDNYDKDLNDKVKVINDKEMITYIVKDGSFNQGEKTRKIIYKDVVKPVIELVDGNEITTFVGSNYVDKYKAIDNCDGDITDKVKVTSNFDNNKVGTYEIIYEVSDKENNSEKVTRKITVNQSGPYSGSTIYLTFDDGPSGVTPALLDVLKKYNVKATFFVTCHDDSINDLIKREYDEGHTIGLHSCTHNYNIYTNTDTYFNDLNMIENKIINITGNSSKIIRFPGGSSNTISRNYSNGIMSIVAQEVTNRGYIYFDWNVGSSDTSTNTAEETCNNVRQRLGRGTNIVLMHDFANKKSTPEAAECIIKYGLSKGYSFDKITKNTEVIHHRIAN